MGGGAGGAKYELYEYPGRFMDNNAGEGAMRQRMQAAETDHNRVAGQSRVRRCRRPGASPPTRCRTPSAATSRRSRPGWSTTRPTRPTTPARAARRQGGAPSYTNAFDATPASVPATPHRDTHQPRIDGAQIAIVAGPAGEEIHTDQYGRVKLWFPWDRAAKKDGTDTVWVRVASPGPAAPGAPR